MAQNALQKQQPSRLNKLGLELEHRQSTDKKLWE